MLLLVEPVLVAFVPPICRCVRFFLPFCDAFSGGVRNVFRARRAAVGRCGPQRLTGDTPGLQTVPRALTRRILKSP